MGFISGLKYVWNLASMDDGSKMGEEWSRLHGNTDDLNTRVTTNTSNIAANTSNIAANTSEIENCLRTGGTSPNTRRGMQDSAGNTLFGGYTWNHPSTGVYNILKSSLGIPDGVNNCTIIVTSATPAEVIMAHPGTVDFVVSTYVNGVPTDSKFSWMVIW